MLVVQLLPFLSKLCYIIIMDKYKNFFDENIEKMEIEKELPQDLKDDIVRYAKGINGMLNGTFYKHYDVDFVELQSNINVYENGKVISSETANYLRKKYLYD